jgi:murein DD-endopeptidase MepM/ murein hydrolase activator NlpD
VELGCDDAVLAGRPAAERRSYAAALVAQLRRQAVHAPPSMAPAFGQLGVAARVARMRDLRPARLSGRARCTLALTALTLAVATAGLQPTLPAAPALTTAATTTPPHLPAMPAPPIPGWRYPLQGARVTALYGVRSAYVPAGHHGVDFAARRGDAVLAVAAGRVREAGADPVWGNFVRVDHGAGRQSLVMHLDRIDVARGQDVASGQRLGAAGATGGATGPHLHLEYWQDGRRGDPARMFADLDRHATPRALARRAAQGHPQPIDG